MDEFLPDRINILIKYIYNITLIITNEWLFFFLESTVSLRGLIGILIIKDDEGKSEEVLNA